MNRSQPQHRDSKTHASKAEQALRRLLHRSKPGDKLPAERVLAGEIGVSIPKVREALTLLAHQGLVVRSHGRGTFVGEPPVPQAVAVVMIHDLAHPTHSFHERAVYQQVRRGLVAAGVPCRGYTAYDDPSDYGPLDCPEFWDDLDEERVRHVVAVGGGLPDALRAELAARGIDASCANRDRSIERVQATVRQGVHYLQSQGRQRLAMMAWVDPALTEVDPTRRAIRQDVVFREELAAAGLPLNEAWIKCDLHPNVTGAGWQEFRDIWFAGPEKPDGLLICNDILARDAGIAIAELGIACPDDLLLVARENRGSARWYPFPIARLESDPAEDGTVMVHDVLVSLGQTPAEGRGGLPSPLCRLVPLAMRGPRMVGPSAGL